MKERLPNQVPNMIDRLHFLNRLRVGKGDYTAQKLGLFKGESVKSIITAIKAQRVRSEDK